MKILVLIMAHSTNDNIFLNHKKIWEEQILSIDKNIINFKFLYSDENITDEYKIIDNNLISKCTENYWHSLAIKTLNGFDFFIKNKYDLIFKTNLSTIINFNKFIKYCENAIKSRDTIYDGIVGYANGYKFCSGAGMLLNKKTVHIVLQNKDKLNEKWTDDIFIGYILNKLNNINTNEGCMTRLDILNKYQNINKNEVLNASHIRIKIRDGDADIKYSNIIYQILKEYDYR